MRYKEASKKKALVAFVVLGDPDENRSLQIIKAVVDGGADILEFGIPFSDPLADGPTIQAANNRALDKGINTDKAFSIIRKVRKFTEKPIGLLVYYNLIIQKGLDDFYREARKAGVDSILVADLPVEEAGNALKTAGKHRISQVFIVSQLTSIKRIKQITGKSSGFVYAVARLGVTGARGELKNTALELVKRIKANTRLPVFAGFGISKPEHVKRIVKAGADGAIVGSAIVKLIENKASLTKIRAYVAEMKKATQI